eukprot:3099752-Prymnesium_polylepis.1
MSGRGRGGAAALFTEQRTRTARGHVDATRVVQTHKHVADATNYGTQVTSGSRGWTGICRFLD